jgi:hypothetical protein
VRTTGRFMTLIGAAVYVIALATLHWDQYTTLWKVEKVGPAVMTGVAVCAAIFALVSFAGDTSSPGGFAAAFGGLALGLGFYVAEHADYSFYGPGYWVANVAALVMAVGGILSTSGYRGSAGVSAGQTTTGAAPPAGWYPDPSGQAGQRYWNGSGWSEHVQ